MTTIQSQSPFGPEELVPFTIDIFDREEEKAARILHSILETHSTHKSNRSQVFSAGYEGSSCRAIDQVRPKLRRP